MPQALWNSRPKAIGARWASSGRPSGRSKRGRTVIAKGNRPQRARRGRPPKTRRTGQVDPDRARFLKHRRFELKLSELDFERLDRLVGLTGAASMGEVIRDAVREYEARIIGGKKTDK